MDEKAAVRREGRLTGAGYTGGPESVPVEAVAQPRRVLHVHAQDVVFEPRLQEVEHLQRQHGRVIVRVEGQGEFAHPRKKLQVLALMKGQQFRRHLTHHGFFGRKMRGGMGLQTGQHGAQAAAVLRAGGGLGHVVQQFDDAGMLGIQLRYAHTEPVRPLHMTHDGSLDAWRGAQILPASYQHTPRKNRSERGLVPKAHGEKAP